MYKYVTLLNNAWLNWRQDYSVAVSNGLRMEAKGRSFVIALKLYCLTIETNTEISRLILPLNNSLLIMRRFSWPMLFPVITCTTSTQRSLHSRAHRRYLPINSLVLELQPACNRARLGMSPDGSNHSPKWLHIERRIHNVTGQESL